jgi:hypothetical protein
MITVRELIEALQKLDPKRVVICQKDSEGNAYSPLSTVGDGVSYLPDTTWSGEIHDDEPDGDDNLLPCVLLIPTN